MIWSQRGDENEELIKIELGGNAIWDQKDNSAPTYISSGWKSGESRTVGAGSSQPLLFQFDEEAGSSSSDCNLRIDLDNGCEVRN